MHKSIHCEFENWNNFHISSTFEPFLSNKVCYELNFPPISDYEIVKLMEENIKLRDHIKVFGIPKYGLPYLADIRAPHKLNHVYTERSELHIFWYFEYINQTHRIV